MKSNNYRSYEIKQEAAIHEILRLKPSQSEAVPILKISEMALIDCAKPNVEGQIKTFDNRNKIKCKTKDNLTNKAYELKTEKYAWYIFHLYGENGLKKQCDVPIIPLDYVQYRILGSYIRFQRNVYLVYAIVIF